MVDAGLLEVRSAEVVGGVHQQQHRHLLGGFCLEPEHLVYVRVWPMPPAALAVDEQGCRECWKSDLVCLEPAAFDSSNLVCS